MNSLAGYVPAVRFECADATARTAGTTNPVWRDKRHATRVPFRHEEVLASREQNSALDRTLVVRVEQR